jgi:phosphatidylserine/phosphatidylglycerophosphate/cardiolipin synthase-like enzyme
VAALSSRAAFISALASARRVDLAAYALTGSGLVAALGAAAERGATVRVSLEAAPYARDPKRAAALREQNAASARALRERGVAVRLSHDADAPLHLKAAVVDRALFLDDRNWPASGPDTILRTTAKRDVAAAREVIAGRPAPPAPLALRKDRALAAEARVIGATRGDRIDCESESFSASVVSRALVAAARTGKHVRVLVAEREVRAGGRRELAALRALRAAGAEVRTVPSDEKLCITADGAWAGSANASGGAPHTVDWGLSTHRTSLVAALEARFESSWRAGAPVRALA